MIVGIDPDTDKSGVAILTAPDYRTKNIVLDTIPLWIIFDFILETATKAVFVEAGWLNKKGLPFGSGQARAIRTGENHAIGKQIVAFCRAHDIPCHQYKPTTKKWTHEDFVRITGSNLGKSNQEERDAARAVLCHKDLRIYTTSSG